MQPHAEHFDPGSFAWLALVGDAVLAVSLLISIYLLVQHTSTRRYPMRVAEIMSTNVRTTSPSQTADDAYDVMRRHEIHHLVVMEEGRVVGVLSDRDLGGPNGSNARRGRTVGDLMSSHAISAKPDTPIKDAANLLRGRGIGCLPVLERRKLVGIVTAADLLELLGRGAVRPTPRGVRAQLTRATPRYGGMVGVRG